MSYNPHNQYRCTIIRGKAKNLLDDLLPAYANIVNEITPTSLDSLHSEFNSRLKKYLPGAEEKTLDNHLTEIVWKLFGMIYVDEEGIVFSSERTQKFLSDGDQPSFFKDFCYKFQFPNAADSVPKLSENIERRIAIRPYCFVIKVLRDASQRGAKLSKDEIAYFILNNLDALQGKATSKEIVDAIFKAREDKKLYKVEEPGKESSYNMQHITEQLNYLELANLIKISEGLVHLNEQEATTINEYSEKPEKLYFDIYSYSLESTESRKKLYDDWQEWYSLLSEKAKGGGFETSVSALESLTRLGEDEEAPAPLSQLVDTIQIGDDGERLVYEYEVKRIKKYDRRLTNKIHMLGKTKGLGYDIQSIFGDEKKEDGEFVKYIEVKSTKRVTLPNIEGDNWFDTLNVTRNEWVAATQHKDAYEIYRVYFTGQGTVVAIIKNPFQKNEQEQLKVLPISYRLDFDKQSLDTTISEEELLSA
jgi:hypothetical protein